MTIVGFFLGIVSHSFAKDLEARQKCLQKTSHLKAQLEALYRHLFSHETQTSDLPKLMLVKSLLEEIEVEKTGLAFKCFSLDQAVEESLKSFEQVNPDHENCAYHPTQIAHQLILEWGCEDGFLPKFDKIIKIQKKLSRSLPYRFVDWVRHLFSSLFEGIKK